VTGTTHKTVKRIVEAHEQGHAEPKPRGHNYEDVAEIVRARVARTNGRITAKRLLPEALATGYTGSARNFRRLVAEEKDRFRQGNHRGRRPGVWAPGEVLAIDWGVESGLHVFCAVSAWSRFRFVRFADNERRQTTLSFLAECFEVLGGVPKVVLADRMGCLKGAVVANLVVPVPDYVRFATHYGFRPDFCEAADPESKGLVEHLVGYAKTDLLVPEELSATDLSHANTEAKRWCGEVNGTVHSEIFAIEIVCDASTSSVAVTTVRFGIVFLTTIFSMSCTLPEHGADVHTAERCTAPSSSTRRLVRSATVGVTVDDVVTGGDSGVVVGEIVSGVGSCVVVGTVGTVVVVVVVVLEVTAAATAR
jgi:transposase